MALQKVLILFQQGGGLLGAVALGGAHPHLPKMLVAVVAGNDEAVVVLDVHALHEVEPDGYLRAVEGRLLDVAEG